MSYFYCPKCSGTFDPAFTYCPVCEDVPFIEQLQARIAELEANIANLNDQLEEPQITSDLLAIEQARVAELEAENARLEQVCAGEKNVVMSYVEESKELRAQLAVSQAREQQLREAAKDVCRANNYTEASQAILVLNRLLLTDQDTYALEAIVKKAGEVMRERCGMTMLEHYDGAEGKFITETIRDLPGITLKDLP